MIYNTHMSSDLIQTTQFIISRLERISADSVVAHRASGVRGAMLRAIEQYEHGNPIPEGELRNLNNAGYRLLQKAASEIDRAEWKKD